jgi:hypothetical protein
MKELHKYYGDSVDYPASLVMSGVESDTYFDIAVGEDVDRLLMSYLYIQRKGKNFLKKRLANHPKVKLMIDSGAHTFHAKEEDYKHKPLSFWENYLEKYVNFIKANKEHIFSCVELDIGNLVGFDKVDYFREKYFEPLKDEGILVCYVWHEYDGKKYWDMMCRKYDYVGFSLTNSTLSEPDIMKMMNTARRHGALVHGFAVTRVELMSRVPFFTGDSTTWLVGTQYGELNWFDGRRMKRLKKDKWKRDYKAKYIKLGANWDLAGQENPYELIRINLLVFKQAEEYIRKRVRHKMYWTKNVTGGGNSDMTKKLVKRKKKVEEPTPVEEPVKKKTKLKLKSKKKAVEPKVEVPKPKEAPAREEYSISREFSDVPEKPKTKFEEFQSLSQPKEKQLKDLAEQIEKLPPMSWYDSDCEDYKDVYRDLGLKLDGMDKEEVLDVLFNFSMLLGDDPSELEEQEDDGLTESAKFFCKGHYEDRDSAVDALKDYFSKNLTGERDDFKMDDGGELEAPERPKEREEYLQDDEYEMVDMSEDELSNYLPAPAEDGTMPEVDELDRELATKGIQAVRDDKGRFLKGQKKVRKPKQLYSKHFPKLACNTCYKAGECPEYKPDHACAYDSIFKKFKTRDMEDLIDAMHGMADLNMERMQRLMLFETMDGGMADPTLTGMIDQNLNIMMKMKQLHEAKAQMIATQRRTRFADGREETETSVTNPAGGILSQIFGMGDDEPKAEKERRDVTPKEDIINQEL